MRSSFLVGAMIIASVGAIAFGSVSDTVGGGDLAPMRVDEATIEKGRYLATAGNCFSCHTTDADRPYAGGVPFFTDFGTLYSANITPDRSTGIGEWTEQDFIRAMRSGVGRNGEHLYPAFPYTYYTKLGDDDLRDLFAFLQTLRPVEAAEPANELKFPLSNRATLAAWKLLFFDEGRFEHSSERTTQQNRGAYLVEGLGHCGACHTPRNFLGAENTTLPLAGGELYDYISTGDIRAWSAVNLTQHESGLKQWTAADIFDYLKTGHARRAVSFGPMNEVIANSTRHLSDADLNAIAAYLKSLPPLPDERPSPVDERPLKTGELVYIANCGSCHLLTGAGSEETAPPLQGSPLVQAASPASLINVILHGPAVSPALHGGVSRPDMPPFEAKLDDDEVALVATYVRNSWGNAADPVSADQVAAQR